MSGRTHIVKTEHKLKTEPKYFWEVRRGVKMFEVRVNDRDFRVGDILILQEFVTRGYLRPGAGWYTGEECRVQVTHMMEGGERFLEGLPSNIVIMSFVHLI